HDHLGLRPGVRHDTVAGLRPQRPAQWVAPGDRRGVDAHAPPHAGLAHARVARTATSRGQLDPDRPHHDRHLTTCTSRPWVQARGPGPLKPAHAYPDLLENPSDR